MNDELKRFFDSIGFNGEGFSDAVIEKVVLRKKEETFLVFLVFDFIDLFFLFWSVFIFEEFIK